MSRLNELWFECSSQFPCRNKIRSYVSTAEDLLTCNPSDSRTALHILADSTYLEDAALACKTLFEEYDIDPNEVVDGSEEALICNAIRADNEQLVSLLFKHGQDSDCVDCEGLSLIELAVESLAFDSLPSLIRFGCTASESMVHLLSESVFDDECIQECASSLVSIGKKEDAEKLIELYRSVNADIGIPIVADTENTDATPEPEGPSLSVYSKSDVLSVLDSTSPHESSLAPVLRRLLTLGEKRRLVEISDSVYDRLIAMKVKFPNFVEVIDHLVQEISLSEYLEGSPVYFSPVLLAGDPGAGKTKFISSIAKALNTEHLKVDCASLSPSVFLCGEPSVYRDAAPGKIASYFKNGGVANPVVMLDEIDKSRHSNGSGYAPFFGLLEDETSSSFEDAFCQIPFNYSRISFVASANDLEPLPVPIKSRMKIFRVTKPTREQMEGIITSIYGELLQLGGKGLAEKLPPRLDSDQISLLSRCSPRLAKKTLRQLIGRTIYKGRLDKKKGSLVFSLSDLKQEVEKARRDQNKTSIGFVSSN